MVVIRERLFEFFFFYKKNGKLYINRMKTNSFKFYIKNKKGNLIGTM